MWSARAVGYVKPMPKLTSGGHSIEWVISYKYLGYLITAKFDWGQIKIRQQTAMINSIRYGDEINVVYCSSCSILNVCAVLFLLVTELQRLNLDYF